VKAIQLTQPHKSLSAVWRGKKSYTHMRLLAQERVLLVPSRMARTSAPLGESSQELHKSCASNSTLSAQEAHLRVCEEQRMVPGVLGLMHEMALWNLSLAIHTAQPMVLDRGDGGGLSLREARALMGGVTGRSKTHSVSSGSYVAEDMVGGGGDIRSC
jgi:hypothetical protein